MDWYALPSRSPAEIPSAKETLQLVPLTPTALENKVGIPEEQSKLTYSTDGTLARLTQILKFNHGTRFSWPCTRPPSYSFLVRQEHPHSAADTC